ncbi:sensor domain-containing diguanylate cyclase [Arcobacteraceae bacterium]|nr:sensor domain-containing diguanylate cyclase [Arcobacteraceae bacterium]
MLVQDSDFIHIDDMNQFNSGNLEALLHKVLNHIRFVTNADAGTIYLEENNELKFSIFQNNSFDFETIFKLQAPLKEIRFPIKPDTETLAVESFINSKVIAIDDMYEKSIYNFSSSKDFDKRFNYKSKSILTAPLIDKNSDKPIGVLQLINKTDKNGKLIPFTEYDKEFIALAGYLIVLSIISTKNSTEELRQLNLDLEEQVIQRTQELKDQTNRDPMTNLYNRRYLDSIIKEIFPILQRGETSMSILMIDIDNFKCVNDKYGHAIGDIVINRLASIFRSTLRSSDIAIRFGGEEFLILLTNTNLKNSVKIAEKIRSNTELSIVHVEDKEDIHFTISIGVNEVNKDDKSINQSLDLADKALYKAKNNGKNQVCYL